MAVWAAGVVPDLLPKLAAAGIHSLEDFCTRSNLDLVESLDMAGEAVRQLRSRIADDNTPPLETVGQLAERLHALGWGCLATGLPELDDALGGGLVPGTITELVGPAGLGKTQFCLSAVARQCAASLRRPAGRVLYIDSERKFSSSRLLEIVRARDPGTCSAAVEQQALDSVFVLQPGGMRELTAHLQGLESTSPAIRLLVIDSVAQLVRPAQGAGVAGLTARQGQLAQLAGGLKRLACAQGCPVLATNQVSTDAGGGLAAALGTLWSHVVDARLQLHQTAEGTRFAQLTKAVAGPGGVLAYRVTQAGIVAHPDAPPPPRALLRHGADSHAQRILHAGHYAMPP